MPMSSDDPRNSNASTASWIISDTFAPIMCAPSNSSLSASAMNFMKPVVSPDVRARALAVTMAKRSKFSPEWPTLQEAGVKEVDASNWTALFAPKGTPQPVIDKLNAEVVKILNMPDVKERFAGGGVDTIPSTAAELDARVKQEAERFKVIVQKANVRPD